jgi:DNA-binding response OmpR family regulator
LAQVPPKETIGDSGPAGGNANSASKLPRVLVVEDDEAVRDIVGDTARRLGFEVHTAANGATALLELGHRDYAVVFLDLKLPRTSGLKVLQTMRAMGIETPAFILTAVQHGDVVAQASQAGASGFLFKPFEVAQIHTTLLPFVSPRTDEPAAPAGATAPTVATGSQR